MVILGLGSNVGEREAYLRAAVGRLRGILTDVTLSRVLESKALPCQRKQPGMDRPFLNMAVRGQTTLEPLELLAAIKQMERELGRVERGVWGPREIDIDILAMGCGEIGEGSLVVPHRELLNRDFALIPFNDVAAEWRYPVEGEYQGLSPAEIITRKRYAIGEDLRETGLGFDD